MTTNETIPAEPCPFCGGDAMLYIGDRYACCADDECAGYTLHKVTVEAWNRRATRPSSEALQRAREDEREACAKIADEHWDSMVVPEARGGSDVARRIRARAAERQEAGE